MSDEGKRIDGKLIAEDVVAIAKAHTEKLVASKGITPGLAVIIVGEDPASQFWRRCRLSTMIPQSMAF